MDFLLVVALAVVSGFLGLLFYCDASPKMAFAKIARHLFGLSISPEPIVHDSPYRRTRRASGVAHHPVLLCLETSDGSGQACHPDVVHIPGGFGAKKWPYWMVCTPYPYLQSKFENPEVFASHDGLTWTVPQGAQNPLVPPLAADGDHNSDPDIVFHGGELWLYFRETLQNKKPEENSIYLMKSGDGIRWSAPRKILCEQAGKYLMSPAVIHDADGFQMWTVEVCERNLTLMFRESLDGVAWGSATPCKVLGLRDGRHPWHIDVLLERDRLSALFVSCESFGGKGSRIHYAYSQDGGLSWNVGDYLFEQTYEFEANVQYRGSLVRDDGGPDRYRLWYSAASLSNVFAIAHLTLVRTEDNRLLPLGSPSISSEAVPALK